MPRCPSPFSRDSDFIGPRVGGWVEAGSWLTGHQDSLKTPPSDPNKTIAVNDPQKSHVLICRSLQIRYHPISQQHFGIFAVDRVQVRHEKKNHHGPSSIYDSPDGRMTWQRAGCVMNSLTLWPGKDSS